MSSSLPPAQPHEELRMSTLTRRKMVDVVAALVAVAFVAALVLNALSLPSRRVGPGNPIVPGIPVSLPKAGALAPGTYFLANPDPVCAGGCSAYAGIYFTLPAGWASSNGLVYKHLNQPGEVAFNAWTVDQVYADPCRWQGSALSPLDITHSSYDPATGALILVPYGGGVGNQALRGAFPPALAPVKMTDFWGGGKRRGLVLRIKFSMATPPGIFSWCKGA